MSGCRSSVETTSETSVLFGPCGRAPVARQESDPGTGQGLTHVGTDERGVIVHEQSLMAALLGQVARLAAEHRATGVEEICVEIGRLSGVEPTLLELAFADQVPRTRFRDARLRIVCVGLQAVCCDCGAEFEVEGFRFRCTTCRSARVRVTRGDDFLLRDVVIRTADATDAEGRREDNTEPPRGRGESKAESWAEEERAER